MSLRVPSDSSNQIFGQSDPVNNWTTQGSSHQHSTSTNGLGTIGTPLNNFSGNGFNGIDAITPTSPAASGLISLGNTNNTLPNAAAFIHPHTHINATPVAPACTYTTTTEPPRYICLYPNCPTTFTRDGDLDRHQKSKHFHTQYTCPIDSCESKLSRPDKLRDHLRNVHKIATQAELDAWLVYGAYKD